MDRFIQMATAMGEPVALHIKNDDVAEVEKLLNAGMIVDYRVLMGRSLLHCAAMYDAVNVAKLLVERGVYLEIVHEKTTPLFTAVSNRKLKILRFLLLQGANPLAGHNQTNGDDIISRPINPHRSEIGNHKILDLLFRHADLNYPLGNVLNSIAVSLRPEIRNRLEARAAYQEYRTLMESAAQVLEAPAENKIAADVLLPKRRRM